MTRPLRNLISAVTLAALTGLLVLAATQWTDVFFRFYPAFSRWILGVLAGVTSVTSFPLWEPGLCLWSVGSDSYESETLTYTERAVLRGCPFRF